MADATLSSEHQNGMKLALQEYIRKHDLWKLAGPCFVIFGPEGERIEVCPEPDILGPETDHPGGPV